MSLYDDLTALPSGGTLDFDNCHFLRINDKGWLVTRKWHGRDSIDRIAMCFVQEK